jgi:hypothetical protein
MIFSHGFKPFKMNLTVVSTEKMQCPYTKLWWCHVCHTPVTIVLHSVTICYFPAGTNLTGPLPAQWGDAAAMQAVAQAAVLSAQTAAVQAQAAAEQAMQILLASKDQMRMRLGAAPDMVAGAGGSLVDAAAGVGAAMDAYHQVRMCYILVVT